MLLLFFDFCFDDVKVFVDECKDKDMMYVVLLFVIVEFINNNIGEIKSQMVFMGDFLMMIEKGMFIINGIECVVVSQLVWLFGVYFDEIIDKFIDKMLYSVKVILSCGVWFEFDVDKCDIVGVCIDCKCW